MSNHNNYTFENFYSDIKRLHDESKTYSKYKFFRKEYNSIKIAFNGTTMVLSLEKKLMAYKKFESIRFFYLEEDSNAKNQNLEKTVIRPYVDFLTGAFKTLPINSIKPFEKVTTTENIGILNGEKTATINVKITGRCNENCYFCTQILDNYSFSLEDVKLTVKSIATSKRFKDYKKENIIFHIFGGEPTTHPQFFEIVDFFIEEDYHFRVDTNAVNFSKKKFTDIIKKKPNMEFLISAHAHNSLIYDQVTSSRNLFDKNIEGVKNILRASSGYTEINHLITKENISYLREFLELYLREFRPIREKNVRLTLSTIIVEDLSKTHAQIPYRDVAKAIEKNREFILKHNIPVICVAASIEMDIPYCIIESVTVKTEVLKNELKKRRPVVKNFTLYIEKCNSCYLRNSCVGIQKSYINKYGEGEFMPLTKKDFENSQILKEIVLLED